MSLSAVTRPNGEFFVRCPRSSRVAIVNGNDRMAERRSGGNGEMVQRHVPLNDGTVNDFGNVFLTSTVATRCIFTTMLATKQPAHFTVSFKAIIYV